MLYDCLNDNKETLWCNLSSKFCSNYKLDSNLDEETKQFIAKTQISNSKFYFLTYIDEGGIVENEEEMSILLNKEKKDELFEIATFIIKKGKLTEQMYDLALIYIIRMHVLTCLKLANNPTIYKAIAKQNGWKYDE